MNDLFLQTVVDERIMILRLVLSLLLSSLIGLERESRRQQAGFRTHILISLGSTLLMLLSIYIPQTFQNFQNGDPGRIAAQVVSGIGFLGAGAIFKLGSNVRGLTTAATIWAVAAIGLTVGAGMYSGAVIATLLILFVLIILDWVENRFFPDLHLKILQVHFSSEKIETEAVFGMLKQFQIAVQSVNISHSLEAKSSQMTLYVNIPVKFPLQELYQQLSKLENVSEIKITQDY
ncbi:MAG TPA: MgtC/SapB family protein [Chitinophagales bacterium]|nr:MgtC/SapB family protein [Chitinophagales bacterium]